MSPKLGKRTFATDLCATSNVRVREIIALEQERRAHRLGERVGRAIGEIERRFRVETFAVPLKGYRCGAHLRLVEGDDFNLGGDEQFPKPRRSGRAAAACAISSKRAIRAALASGD